MKRREFITLLGGAAAWPLGARAQQPDRRMAHIAYLGALSPATLDPRQIEQFKAGLVENGLIDGQNISVDYLWAEASPERLRQLAGDLAQRDLDVIVTAGPQPVRAVMATGTKTPIVFAILNDPIGDGFIANLAQPGGNITGLSMAGTDLESKRLEVLKDAAPAVAKVMVPLSGASTPAIMLNSVVLPAPFGPITAKMLPCSISKPRRSTAMRPRKRLLTPSSDRSAVISCAPSGRCAGSATATRRRARQ